MTELFLLHPVPKVHSVLRPTPCCRSHGSGAKAGPGAPPSAGRSRRVRRFGHAPRRFKPPHRGAPRRRTTPRPLPPPSRRGKRLGPNHVPRGEAQAAVHQALALVLLQALAKNAMLKNELLEKHMFV